MQKNYKLRTSRLCIILVTDEFGNVQGLISPLDVFEAIAGEFPDADEQLDLVKVDEHTWKVNRTGFVGDFLFKLGHLT